MARDPFAKFLDGDGLTFGLPTELLEEIGERTGAGISCSALLDDPALATKGVGPAHLLRIRRAYRRCVAREEITPGKRWAGRHARTDELATALTGAFAAACAATLKRGRLRMHLKRADDPRAKEVASLAEHTEGCDEVPPHRWFAASRAVSEGLLWIEVIPPVEEMRRCLGPEASTALVEDLARSIAKPVLDAIGARAEREAIATAAGSLHALLSRPVIRDPVAGLLVDGQHVHVAITGGDHDSETHEFGARDVEGICDWIARRGVTHAGVSQKGKGASLSSIIQALAGQNLAVEPVREAGLMKQARKGGGHIKPAAARVVARRLQDPVAGYADLSPDELGLGEYLDRVDPDRLRAALEDVRDVVGWEREHRKAAAPVARGVGVSPMVKGLDDVRSGMELTGMVANLTHFGAFVELGLPIQGLVHLSELADRFVKHPSEVVQVGERVRVRVLELDQERQRLSLSMRPDRDTDRKRARDKRGQAVRALEDLFKK